MSHAVDVIVPTFNSERTLNRCLDSIVKQEYSDEILITIIDGGSSDDTIQIGKSYGARIVVKNGMYGTGKNGARHYGEKITNSPLIWNIDSDNILLGKDVLSRLEKPMEYDPSIRISIPTTIIDPYSPSINKWISAVEIKKVENMAKKGTEASDGYILMNDMFYGLTNCALVQRTVIENVGGYDSDLRTLSRIRRAGLSKGIIDFKSHFYHDQVESLWEYIKKLDRRIKKFGGMNSAEFKQFFVEYPPRNADDSELKTGTLEAVLYEPFISLQRFFKEKERYWLWGIPCSTLFMAYAALHPLLVKNLFQSFW